MTNPSDWQLTRTAIQPIPPYLDPAGHQVQLAEHTSYLTSATYHATASDRALIVLVTHAPQNGEDALVQSVLSNLASRPDRDYQNVHFVATAPLIARSATHLGQTWQQLPAVLQRYLLDKNRQANQRLLNELANTRTSYDLLLATGLTLYVEGEQYAKQVTLLANTAQQVHALALGRIRNADLKTQMAAGTVLALAPIERQLQAHYKGLPVRTLATAFREWRSVDVEAGRIATTQLF